jgi:hypothetical protein
MKSSISALSAALLLAAPVLSSAQTISTVATPAAKTFSVFVDPPTGFTYVKMPSGWKFVGAVSKEEMRQLPATLLTSGPQPDASQSADGDIVK